MKPAPFHRRHRRKLLALGLAAALPVFVHLGIVYSTGMTPPALGGSSGEVVSNGEGRSLGRSYVRKRGRTLEVRLAGSAEEIGRAHGRLLYDEMIATEARIYETFEEHVRFAPLRWLILDAARVLHRRADASMDPDRLREIAAQAEAFQPDPWAKQIPTYQRFVYLNSLYDIALGFEHSPMLGCTSFVARGAAARGGHALLARNFDFEAGEVYDTGKVVYLILEDGKIPFASVAWPGLVGVLSGMNARGLGVVVHGGRAREPRAVGEPVVHTARALLSEASTVDEAIALLEAREAMVSHILLLVDAQGDAASVERAPGEVAWVRRIEGPTLALTNHFEGPLASDPKNRSVRETTSTLARRARLDELLAARTSAIGADDAVSILRDKREVGGGALAPGDRRALDAIIATHAVVMDATDRVLWVSEGPHLMGRFVRFDLARLLEPGYVPGDEPVVTLPEDPALGDGSYERWVSEGSRHGGGK